MLIPIIVLHNNMNALGYKEDDDLLSTMVSGYALEAYTPLGLHFFKNLVTAKDVQINIT